MKQLFNAATFLEKDVPESRDVLCTTLFPFVVVMLKNEEAEIFKTTKEVLIKLVKEVMTKV